MDFSQLRMLDDIKRVQKEPPPGVLDVKVSDSDMFEWLVAIRGPEDTPFEEGIFNVKLEFPPNYPFDPPKVHFYSRMFHPSVHPDGRLCFRVSDWSPAYDAHNFLYAIRMMLADSCGEDTPANVEASRFLDEDKESYEKRVKEVVEMSKIDDAVVNLNKKALDNEIAFRLCSLNLGEDVEGDLDEIKEFLQS